MAKRETNHFRTYIFKTVFALISMWNTPCIVINTELIFHEHVKTCLTKKNHSISNNVRKKLIKVRSNVDNLMDIVAESRYRLMTALKRCDIF